MTIKAINKIKRPEVIDLDAGWYGGGFHFQLLKDKSGSITFDYVDIKPPVTITEDKLVKFWNEIDNLNVWNWHKEYPYWKQDHEPLLDGCTWELKLRNRKGKSKYCHGYESFPRNFKKLINMLNKLFGTKVEWN